MKTLKLVDKVYKLAEFDEKLASDLLTWAKGKLSDPLDDIKSVIKDFPPRVQEAMVREAMSQKRMAKSIDHPEIQALLKTPEGLEKVMSLMFLRYQPEMKTEEVWQVHKAAVKEYGDKYLEALPNE